MMTTEVITLVVRRVRPLVDGRGRTLIATGVIDSTADIVREKGRHPSPNQRHRNYERQYLARAQTGRSDTFFGKGLTSAGTPNLR